MNRRSATRVALSVVCSILLITTPLHAKADDAAIPPVDPVAVSPVIITEVQTGNAARADEFIELYNTTDEPIDLTGWQVRYVTASATSTKNVQDPSTTIALIPPSEGGEVVLVPANGYYVLYSGAIVLPEGIIGQQYEGLLPATGGSIVLVSPDNDACEFVVEDAIAWGNTTHLFGEGEALVAGAASANDRLFQHYADTEGAYIDAANNAGDFASASAASAVPSPGADNGLQVPETLAAGSGVQSQVFVLRFANSDCTLPPAPEPPGDPPIESPPSVVEPPAAEPESGDPQPVIPQANIGLKTPILSEFLPNPAPPQSDDSDEFIEMYNPNDVYFDLSGYVLEVGLKSKRLYEIPQGIKIAPRAFLALFSAENKLALSNSGSQVALIDPLGRTLAVSDAYGTAKDGHAWVLANGLWQWTTKPTPNALNVVSAPAVKSAAKKGATVRTASAKKGETGTPANQDVVEDVEQAVALAASTSTPLHPGVLALIGVSAVLYGAYEYRRDVANRIYQFRVNRAARAAARQSAQGR